ncbi:MAG TPA: hypothetical protein VFY75_02435 [Solirubrobacterales bacterium]|nr:hypothetical protein [Solirubrobacterales bacterium]
MVGSTNRWAALNDIITEQQTPTASDYITTSSAGGGIEITVDLSTVQLESATITGATAWFYTPNSNSLTARVRDAAGTTLAAQLFSSTGWHSLPVTLSGSQSQLDGLRLNLRKESGTSPRTVYAAFLKLTLELPASRRLLHVGISADSRSGEPPGEVQDVVAETGAAHLREDLEWHKVEPSDGEWTWGATDLMFEEAAERGMTILPILIGPPCWAVSGTEDPKVCERTYPADDQDFADFTAHVVERYGPGGDFWLANPGLEAGLAPKYFEIWNEPYYPYTVNGEVDPARYADLYTTAVAAGRLANPESKYLIEATWAVDPGPVNWGGAMVAHNALLGNYVDGIAVHPYPRYFDPFAEPETGTLLNFRSTKLIYDYWRSELKINKPIWITEIGYSSCDDEERSDSEKVCVPGDSQAMREEVKAEWLADLFDVIDRGNFGYVHAAYLYNLKQWTDPEVPTNEKSDWFGVIDELGTLPAWTSFTDAVVAYDGTPVPDTTITSKSFSGGGDATFGFSVTDPTSTSECQLDNGAWSACTSPKTYSKVGSGHTFRVRGTNAEATETTPATHSW